MLRLENPAEYSIWVGLKQRCYSQNHHTYPGYGGRGVAVCDRWRTSFATFLADMGPRPSPTHSVDRINNALGYEPSNCRWATPTQQARNTSSTRLITANGVTRCLAEWADLVGCHPSAISHRIRKGWSVEHAVTTPKSRNTGRAVKRGVEP